MSNLKNLRQEKKWSQAVLADKAGVPQTAVSDIETGKRKRPSYALLKKIADALGVNVEDIAPEDEPERNVS